MTGPEPQVLPSHSEDVDDSHETAGLVNGNPPPVTSRDTDRPSLIAGFCRAHRCVILLSLGFFQLGAVFGGRINKFISPSAGLGRNVSFTDKFLAGIRGSTASGSAHLGNTTVSTSFTTSFTSSPADTTTTSSSTASSTGKAAGTTGKAAGKKDNHGQKTTTTTGVPTTPVIEYAPMQIMEAGSTDLSSALACLRLTSPNLRDMMYPGDAEAHFQEVNKSFDKWLEKHKYHCAAGYCGPWVENHWIHYFSNLWKKRASGTRLQDIFGPYIPILIPWVDTWVNSGYRFPPGMAEELRDILRPNVLYITVAQNDEGLLARVKYPIKEIPNVLVLSAGGYGHVPVPLLKANEKLVHSKVEDRKYIVSFMGSMGHAPRNLRGEMGKIVNDWARKNKQVAKVGSGKDWRDVMADSVLNLVPRGFGRSSYHIAETFQMGLVPIHIYSDIPWVYYGELWRSETIGFVTSLAGLDALLTRLAANISKIVEVEQNVRRLRESHFLVEGVMDQIHRFMTGQPNDLRCQKLPAAVK
mmetsp:Transcript_34777/g.63301  ORF Transcript_34777/g.63301 Transcript_34777/m.63301 type:complete len:525 (-) Transcript_34777:10-1584(-)